MMHTILTAAEIEQIATREAKATPGPWEWDDDLPLTHKAGDWENRAPWLIRAGGTQQVLTGEIAGAPQDAEFIACARVDIHRLLATLATYQRVAEAASEYLVALHGAADCTEPRSRLERALAALPQELSHDIADYPGPQL